MAAEHPPNVAYSPKSHSEKYSSSNTLTSYLSLVRTPILYLIIKRDNSSPSIKTTRFDTFSANSTALEGKDEVVTNTPFDAR